MFLPIENSLATLKNEVRTNWVLFIIQSFVPLLLLRQKHDSTIVHSLSKVLVSYGVSYVTPHVRGIVTV